MLLPSSQALEFRRCRKCGDVWPLILKKFPAEARKKFTLLDKVRDKPFRMRLFRILRLVFGCFAREGYHETHHPQECDKGGECDHNL